jgi:SAM-dependent methyltransferase
VSGSEPPPGDLTPPVVPAEAYTEEYYRTANWGHETWAASEGAIISPIYPSALRMAGLRPTERVVDIGTGRGELLVAAVQAGADRAVGVEYSTAALDLARRTLVRHEVTERAEVIEADARSIPLDDGWADLVTLLDVAEHLSPAELAGSLDEAHRILRPGGRVFVHTMPNRLIYDVTYRVLRATVGRSWPKDPRNAWEHQMHVNEQSARSLRDALRGAGFQPDVRHGKFVYVDFFPSPRARALVRAMSRLPGLRRLALGDLWGTGLKPAA